MSDATGTTLRAQIESAVAGRYVIERELGRGGMGAVFLARDPALDRHVALKLLPPELAVQAELRARFLRETRTAAGFSHPNIVAVHAVEEHGPLLYFVMGYVDGETLTQRVARAGPLGAREVTRLVQEVAWALAYAHGRGVVHRDVKPDNILIERATGRALVTDFGIAHTAAPSGLTGAGEVIGTPHFMSPEQAAGEAVDGRSDLYSLGIVAFFAVTGRLPFTADSTAAILAMQLTREPPAVASLRPDLPAPLTAAIDRCLAKEPSARFPNGEAMVDALEAVRATQPEVAPAIRYFQLKGDAALRSMLVVSLLAPKVVGSAKGDADRLGMATLVLAILGALLWQIVYGMRMLAAQGFAFDDLRAALDVVAAERAAAREQYRDTEAAVRLRRRLRVARWGAALAAVALIVGSLTQRERMPWGYRIGMAGMVMMVVGVVLGAVVVVSLVMQPGRASLLERVTRALWGGAVGRRLFAVGRIGLAPAVAPIQTAGRAPGVTGQARARTLLAALPRPVRGQLGDASEVLAALDERAAQLGARETTLAHAESEAQHDGEPSAMALSDAVRERLAGERGALLGELAEARRQVGAERLAIALATEQLRLQLVRLRSGLGDASDVRRAVDAARALVSTSVPFERGQASAPPMVEAR